MESPPSCSTWSEVFICSDDSGLLLTSGSISSGSMSGDSRSGRCHLALEFQNSDFEDKSLSQADSLDDMSDIICGENFNTLKKGPNWNDISSSKHTLAIEPPPEFQDKPNILPAKSDLCHLDDFPSWLNKYANQLMIAVIKDAMEIYCRIAMNRSNLYYKCLPHQKQILVTPRTFWTSDWLPFSPCHNNARPSSRNSLGSSRLSCSHNSLSVPSTCKVDDSNFITQAVSHDTLTSNQISDLYNVPFDSDMYAVPVDVVKPPLKPKRHHQPKSRRRNTCFPNDSHLSGFKHKSSSTATTLYTDSISKKRHSVAGSSVKHIDEPIHMTLQEVRQYLQTLYSSSSDSSDHRMKQERHRSKSNVHNTEKATNFKYKETVTMQAGKVICTKEETIKNRNKKNNFVLSIKNKKVKDSFEVKKRHISNNIEQERNRRCPVRNFSSSLKQTICNLFRFRRFVSSGNNTNKYTSRNEDESMYDGDIQLHDENRKGPLASRALPPLPSENKTANQPKTSMDFATSIEKVKDYGWYWGPISSEAAERILLNEPDGSFIVRDSSDDHYIFSLTFKLNSGVRHVRIEHDQGNFSFGSCTKFKSHTIIEFIENAVEHSRSGRYLFFLHRRPVLGPMRVQLLHPVSRFKQVQSLQHMCRFVILKIVRKDRIASLPLPRRIIDYLSTQHYYSEQLLEWEELENTQETEPSTQVIEDTRQS